MALALPIVENPMEPLFEHAGVELVLAALECWPHEVIVQVEGLPSDVTEVMERAHHAALEEWGEKMRQRLDEKLPAPVQPAETILALSIALEDDAQTEYRFNGSAIGGTGRMFTGEWRFYPGPNPNARRLTLAVAGESGEAASVKLDLVPPEDRPGRRAIR